MELEPRRWVNEHGIDILEGISEIDYTASGGRLFVHGEVIFLSSNAALDRLSVESIARIDSRREHEKIVASAHGDILSDDGFSVSFRFNTYTKTNSSHPVSLTNFFEMNGIRSFKKITPDMIVNCPWVTWKWSTEPDPNVSEEARSIMF